jgi:hypothetical protein
MEGVTPGLQITDAQGQDFLIKFDNQNYPELQSGAEVISTKILYAAGYNVPENYIAHLDVAKVTIKKGVEFANGGKKRPFTPEDLTNMLRNAAKGPDGRYRVTRIILSFSEDELLNIVKTAEYSNPKASEYVLRALLDRRRQIASHWLEEQNPLSAFAVTMGTNGPDLAFQDLMTSYDLASKAQYQYEVWKGEQWDKPQTSAVTRIPLGNAFDGQMRLRIRAVRAEKLSKPVILVVQSKPGGYGILRIERS